MKTILIALASASAFVSAAAIGQTTTVAPTTATAVVLAPATENVLRAGTPVSFKLKELLTTDGKKLRPGYRFQMEVAEPVVVGQQIVIPAGTPAVGEVTDVKNTGMWGKGGGINARILFARLNGRQIRMTGVFDDKGKSGTVGVVAAVAFLPVAGFFVKGKNANIPLGATVGGFMDEDLAFVPGAVVAPVAAPAVQAVPIAAPAAGAATPTVSKN